MNNNAVFWMNLNNINSNNNSMTRSNKGSNDLFNNVLESASKQSKVTLNKREKIVPINKLNVKDSKLDNKIMEKDTDHYAEQQETIQSSYENINQASDKKQDIEETTGSKDSDFKTETDKDILQNTEEVKESISTLAEVLQAIFNLSQELVPINNNKDIQNIASKINSTELSSKIEEISLQLEKLINNLSNTSQSQSLDLLQELQELQETLSLISKKSAVIEKEFMPELRLKFNELLASIQKLEKPLSDLNIKISQKIQENTEINENNKSSLLSKDTEIHNVNLENENSKVNSIEIKANLNSSDNNSQMQKPMQDILINTGINNNNVIEEFNNLDTKVDSMQKYISLNKDSIFEQVVDKIKVNFTKNTDEIKIKLKPEILGEMTIKIIVEKGLVTAKAIVENYQIKQLLESNLDQLKESFKSEGLNFQALDVSVSKDSGFDRKNANSWTSRNRTKNKKITLNDSNVGSLYDEVNNHTTNIMNMYSTSLDIIV